MKGTIKIDGDFRAIFGTSILEGKRAVTRAVSTAGGSLQGAWRGQIASAGLGSRLQRTIRKKTYPENGTSLRAASLVWSNAGKIVDAFERGVTIRSQNGFYLAIPLSAAGSSSGGKRMTPAIWERKTGRRLTFIFRNGKPPLLVDTGTVTRAAPRVAFGEKQRERRGFKNRTIPIFVVKRTVKLPKKLSLMAAAGAAQSQIPALIVANWQEGRTQ